MEKLDPRDAHHRFVKINVLTDILYEEEVMCQGIANRLNEELDFAGSPFMWMRCGTRAGEEAAA